MHLSHTCVIYVTSTRRVYLPLTAVMTSGGYNAYRWRQHSVSRIRTVLFSLCFYAAYRGHQEINAYTGWLEGTGVMRNLIFLLIQIISIVLLPEILWELTDLQKKNV